MTKKKLIYFTTNYPYGSNEQWKTNELQFLKNYFDKIIVVPYYFEGVITPKVPLNYKNIEFADPLFTKKLENRPYNTLFRSIFSNHGVFFLKDLFANKSFLFKKNIINWINSVNKIITLSTNNKLKHYIKNADENTVLYFFWGRETSEIIPLLSKKRKYKIALRLHGYDLYDYRNDGYVPFQLEQINNADNVLSVSIDGQKYLQKKYPSCVNKIITSYLGTISIGKAKISNDGCFRLFSCSSIIPLKRIHLIVEILKFINFPIIWTHIGNGILSKDIEALTTKLTMDNKNIIVNFTGLVSNEKVMLHYVDNFVDLFINVSEAEGVPVSIMEAMASGVPVIATNVGGTSEIVNDDTGRLIGKNFDPRYVAQLIEQIYNLPISDRLVLSENAYKKYESTFSSENNTNNLANLLLRLL